jgi:2-polyprenyl-3-methyl-5-hydroxy-6-metoxy-1,4-benzoquinol methylase
MSDKVKEYFETTINYLHRTFGVRLRAEIVHDFIGNVSDAKILDAGCGDGGVSLQYLTNNQITFCDLSENMLKRVSEQIPPALLSHAKLVNSSIEHFRSEERFDCIFCIGVLAHVPSISECLGQLDKLLNKNGRLIIQFSDYNHWLTKLSISFAGYDYKVNKIRFEELEQLTQQLNYKIEKKIKYNFMLPGMGRLPDSFLYKMQRSTLKLKYLQSIGTEHVWLLKKDSL